jgi:nucleoside-diphosphate-sugar epimerase
MFDNIKNDIYNLASGQGVSIVDLAEIISKKIGANNKIKILGNRVGEVVKFVADINKAKEKLGFNPVIDIEKGVGMSIDWYLNNLYK